MTRRNDVVIRYIRIRKGFNSAVAPMNVVRHVVGRRDRVTVQYSTMFRSHWNQDEGIGGGATALRRMSHFPITS